MTQNNNEYPKKVAVIEDGVGYEKVLQNQKEEKEFDTYNVSHKISLNGQVWKLYYKDFNSGKHLFKKLMERFNLSKEYKYIKFGMFGIIIVLLVQVFLYTQLQSIPNKLNKKIDKVGEKVDNIYKSEDKKIPEEALKSKQQEKNEKNNTIKSIGNGNTEK